MQLSPVRRFFSWSLCWLVFGLALGLPAQVGANWSAGVAASHGQSPYRGVSSNPNTIPAFISYRGRFAYIQGLEAGLNAWGTGGSWGGLQASLLVSARMAGYSSRDSQYLQGMSNRGWSLDGGVGFSGRVHNHQFSVKAVQDLLAKHQGYELSGSYSYGFQVAESLRISPGMGLIWQSTDLVNYYYGVNAEEARLDLQRPAYQAGAGWKPSLTLNLLYDLSDHSSLMLAGRTRWLPKSAADSPLVARDRVSGVFVAYLYRF